MSLRDQHIGFLGGGHMGRALAAALVRAEVPREQIHVAEVSDTLRHDLERSLGIRTVENASALPTQLDVLILAVKPQDLTDALAPLKARLAQRAPLVISIAAGVTLDALHHACGTTPKIIRAMPNRPASLGAGATALFAPPEITSAERELASSVFATAGIVVWVDDETLMDVVTAISGSGPAYFLLLAEAMVDAATSRGLPLATAVQLARATLQGAGVMCTEPVELAALRASVTSKEGTTAAALDQFRAGEFQGLVAKAVDAAIIRGQELAKKTRGGS